MSDRIAVMSEARVAQLGSPAEIYENPRTPFVAKFIGESNFFEGTNQGRDGGHWRVDGPQGAFRVPEHAGAADGRPVKIAVRPEWLDVCRPDAVPAGENAVGGHIRDVIYLGESLHVLVDLPGSHTVTVAVRNEGQLQNPLAWRKGDIAAVAWRPEDCQVLEVE